MSTEIMDIDLRKHAKASATFPRTNQGLYYELVKQDRSRCVSEMACYNAHSGVSLRRKQESFLKNSYYVFVSVLDWTLVIIE